jgi:ABC transporter DrrB family efflux protein
VTSNRIPIVQLVLCHIRSYIREPEAIFWTYGFPLLMVIGLGIAFDSSGPSHVLVDVVQGKGESRAVAALSANPTFRVEVHPEDAALQRLRRNRTQVAVKAQGEAAFQFFFDPTNPEARVARDAVDDALQRAAGRSDPLPVEDREVVAPGSRYVDFLVPGLIGMNLMGGGMWGVGFVLVDMRIKKLLKRLLGTPMRRSHFLLSVVGCRAMFFIPEAFVLLLAAHWVFGVPIAGSVPSIILVAFVGAMAFAGLGLLAASRAQRIETVSGIMNLVMLPMWLCSGIFFSSERFPEWMQPFVQALPLTQLINALRAVILEGVAITTQVWSLALLAVWAAVAFSLALRWFRWSS